MGYSRQSGPCYLIKIAYQRLDSSSERPSIGRLLVIFAKAAVLRSIRVETHTQSPLIFSLLFDSCDFQSDISVEMLFLACRQSELQRCYA